MNEYGTRTTKEEKVAFPFDEYPLISTEGTFTVTLIDKSWSQKDYLICAFQTDNGAKFRVNVWRRTGLEIYSPKKSKIDFSKVQNGTKWICTFVRSKNNNIYWKEASPIN